MLTKDEKQVANEIRKSAAPILRYEVDFEMEPPMYNKAKNGKEISKDMDDLMDRLESFNPELVENNFQNKI